LERIARKSVVLRFGWSSFSLAFFAVHPPQTPQHLPLMTDETPQHLPLMTDVALLFSSSFSFEPIVLLAVWKE
jgi:hypothetical protein